MAREKVAMERAALMKQADHALSHLSPHEEFVLRRRFGIGGRQQHDDAIARRLGVHVEDIRHLESSALIHLRQIASEEEEREVESAGGVG